MFEFPRAPADGKVLLIDDDRELCTLLQEYLSQEGLQVTASHTGPDGVAKALSGEFAVVVLDIMLPGLGGLDVLRRIRMSSGVPVLMLSARSDEADRVVGLEMGADDYVPKPCNARELLARIRALLRRVPGQSQQSLRVVLLGDLELDPGTRTVRRAGAPVALTSAEFDLLAWMLGQPGTVINRQELAESALGRKLAPSDRSVDVHISRLRRKLGPHPNGDERIKSVRGAGYLYTFADGH